MGYNSVSEIMGLYLLLAPKSAKSRQIPRKFELIAGQGYPRSSILMSIESLCATSYWSLIITLDTSPTVFEILMFKAIKWLVLPHLPCLMPPLGGVRSFLDETYPSKTRVMMGLLYGVNFIILTSTVLD